MSKSVRSCNHPGSHAGPLRSADGTDVLDQDWTCGGCGQVFNPQQAHDEARANRPPPPACADCGLQHDREKDDRLLGAGYDDERVMYHREGFAEPLCKPCSEKRRI